LNPDLKKSEGLDITCEKKVRHVHVFFYGYLSMYDGFSMYDGPSLFPRSFFFGTPIILT